MTTKKEYLGEDICNGCEEIRKYLDEKGRCILCKETHKGKEIKESLGNYQRKFSKEVFSKTGSIEENKYLR